MNRKYDHVRWHPRKGHFYCAHCNAWQTMPLLAPVAIVIAVSDAFLKLHRRCRAPKPADTAEAEVAP